MARPEELFPGNCYFNVGYLDKDLIRPTIQTLVYQRYEKSEDGELWIFEEGEVDSPPPEFEDMEEQPVLVAFDEESLYQILDIQGLLLVLKEVAEFHPLHTVETTGLAIGVSEDVKSNLKKHIDNFLFDGKQQSLTITIRFTDDALSLGRRREGGFEMGFFPKPKIFPDEERRIRELFHEIGIKPHEDYLADKGRTRVLEFAIPDDGSFVLKLSIQIFIEVYSMRTTDTLRYYYLPTSKDD